MRHYTAAELSQSRHSQPWTTFDGILYGMVGNLDRLTTGTATFPEWRPAKQSPLSHTGKKFWRYGGVGCSAAGNSLNTAQWVRNVVATASQDMNGVEAMSERNRFGFISRRASNYF